MANNFYAAIVLTGGGTGALDAIDGAALADLDAAIVQTDGTVYFYHLDATSGAAESSPDVITPDTNAGTKRWIKQSISGGGGASPDYIKLHDAKSAGTGGGDFTQDAWRKRTLTEDQDAGGHCSVASSVFTLAAGTYDCHITSPAFDVIRHKARLRNTTDGATTIAGTAMYCHANYDPMTNSVIRGRFTIAGAKAFEVQHWAEQTRSGGFGVATNVGEDEIYCVAEFWKIS